MRSDLQTAWDLAKKTDGTIYKNPNPDEIEQLKKLAELLEAGIINQQEFDEKKKSLIDRI